jgi:hypothetical protein
MVLPLVLSQHERCRDHGPQRERDVDQENRPPRESPNVGGKQKPAENLAGDGRKADDGAEYAERLAALLACERHLDDGEHLRIHQRAADTLNSPRSDQHPRRRRQTAKRGRRPEHQEAEDE